MDAFILCVHCRHIVTTCSSGEMKLWTNEGWRCEDVTLAPMAQQHHVSLYARAYNDINDDKFCLILCT